MKSRKGRFSQVVLIFAVITSAIFFNATCEGPTESKEKSPAESYGGQTTEDGACVWVEPYRRSDGTCVRGHWRSAPGKKCSLVGKVYKDCP